MPSVSGPVTSSLNDLPLRTARWGLLLLLCVGMLLRLAAGEVWRQHLPAGDRFGFGDSPGYWALGEAVAHGKPYSLPPGDQRVFRMPGYPACLALLWHLVGGEPSLWLAQVQNALFSTATIVAVYWLARAFAGRTASLVAAACVTFYPGAIAMSAFVLTEAVFSLLCVLCVGCLVRANPHWMAMRQIDSPQALVANQVDHQAHLQRKHYSFALLAGLAAGLAILVRPSWLLFLPLCFVLACLPERIFAKVLSRRMVGVALLTTLAVLTPWWVRNFWVCGKFVPTTLQVGASLYDGWGPQATGASDMRFVEPHRQALLAQERSEQGPAKETFEYRLDQHFRQQALQWAQAHPTQVLRLAWIKLGRLWNVWPNETDFRSRTLCFLVASTYLPLMFCLLLGTIRAWRLRVPLLLLWLPCLYFTLLHMVFVSSLRYRDPPLLVAMPLAGLAFQPPILSRGALTEERARTER